MKSWPIITIVTISLCYLTELVAGWCGLELPEQKNIEIVRALYAHAFDSWKYFWSAALNTALILAILPAIEELVFRPLLFRLPADKLGRPFLLAALSSALFSAAHYIAQPWPDNAFLALFFFGLAQCWLYRKTERLWCPILNHALFNLTNLVLLLILPHT